MKTRSVSKRYSKKDNIRHAPDHDNQISKLKQTQAQKPNQTSPIMPNSQTHPNQAKTQPKQSSQPAQPRQNPDSTQKHQPNNVQKTPPTYPFQTYKIVK